jgi:hypothetical protein
MALKGSIAVVPVVPIVAITQQGINPCLLSFSIASLSITGSREKSSFTGIFIRFLFPIPLILTALSTEECVWPEQYTLRVPACSDPRPHARILQF